MDINKKLNNILTKYNIPKGKLYKRIQIYEAIREEFSKIAALDKICAFRGGGAFALEFLESFGNVFMPQFIIDNELEAVRERLMDYGIPVVKEEDIDYKTIDLFIVANFDYREEIKSELKAKGIDKEKIYDIHDMLEKRGLSIECPFWRFFDEPYHDIIEDNVLLKELDDSRNGKLNAEGYYSRYVDYLERAVADPDKGIYDKARVKPNGHKARYGSSNCINESREKLIFDLISKYLDIRDFVSAFLLIDEYIDRKYNNWETLKSLKMELKCLLSEIKDTLSKKGTKDILWLWQDALLFDRIKDMPNLKRIADSGVLFRNVYTPGPVTRSVYARCLDQQEEYQRYEDISKHKRKYALENYLLKNGIVPIRITKSGQESIPMEKLNYNTFSLANVFYTSVTDMYWATLNVLINAKETLFLLVHTGTETHDPFASPWLARKNEKINDEYIKWSIGEIDDIEDSFIERMKVNYKYIDCQIRYFYDLLPDKSIKLLMSDHGFSMRRDVFSFSMDYLHAGMIVSGEGIEGRTEERLFTFENFINLIRSLIDPGGVEDWEIFSDYIYLYQIDIYNSQYIDILIKNNTELTGLSFSGIMSVYDRYIRLGNGMEIYNTKDNWEENLIENAQYAERINFLKGKMEERGYHFLDINNIEKFKSSQRLYKSLEIKQRKSK